jgi:hypothetical protein
MNELRKVVPAAASYVSESNYFNDSWQESFWGPNYSRLRAIKAKYDRPASSLCTTVSAAKIGALTDSGASTSDESLI